jgi:hypothetical protein
MFRRISQIIIKPEKYLKISNFSNTLCTNPVKNLPVVTIIRSKTQNSQSSLPTGTSESPTLKRKVNEAQTSNPGHNQQVQIGGKKRANNSDETKTMTSSYSDRDRQPVSLFGVIIAKYSPHKVHSLWFFYIFFASYWRDQETCDVCKQYIRHAD